VGPSFSGEFPGASPAAADCLANLVRTATEVVAEVDRRQRSVAPLSTAGVQVLAIVEDEPLPPHVIVDRLLVTSGTMTSLLDTLERRGMIRRSAHPDDRRKILVHITDAGRDVLDAVLPRVHAFSREAFAVLTSREQRELVRMLGLLRGRVWDLRRKPVHHGHGRNKPRPR
jgi:DNA-binding MarR family transcriptional regulator